MTQVVSAQAGYGGLGSAWLGQHIEPASSSSMTDSLGLYSDAIAGSISISTTFSESWELLTDGLGAGLRVFITVNLADSLSTPSDSLSIIRRILATTSDSLNTWADTGSVIKAQASVNQHTLLYAHDYVADRTGWLYDFYYPTALLHYGEEGANIHNILVGGSNGSIYQLSGGTDAGEPIPCHVLTKALDQADPRNNKLYGDIMVDADTRSGDITATIGFDNNSTQAPAVTLNTATRTQIPIPVGNPWIVARNICLDLSWNQTADPAYLYIWEPRFTEENTNLYAYTWSTSYLTHGIKGYFIHGYIYLMHTSTADITFTITDEGGIVAASVTVPHGSGIANKTFVRLPATKGKFFKYTVSSATQFKVDGDNSELLVRPWGSKDPWQRQRIFKDVSQMGLSNDKVLSDAQ